MKKVLNNLNITYRYTKSNSKKSTVLLLHGWGGSLNSFRAIEKQLIDRNYSVITLDFPGFGGSDTPPESFTMKDYYIIVSELLREENLTKVDVIGHSFGGRVAIMLASLEPEKVDRLVLVDSAGIKPKFSLVKQCKILRYKMLKKLKNIGLIKRDLSTFGSEDYKALPQSMKPVFSQIVKSDLSDFAKNIVAPTLLIWGTEDRDTPMYMAKKLNKLISDSAIIKFENCGHFCYLQKPNDFAEIVINFFE